MSREEDMLIALINGESVNITPRTRMEKYLKNCVDGCGCDGLPAPKSRAEILLAALAEKIAAGGGSGGGGVTIRNQNKTITENGTYTADSGYTGLGTVTVEVASGGGGDLDALIDGTITEVNSEVTSIAGYTFYVRTNLESVNMPNVTTLNGFYTFAFCSKLESVKLPKLGNIPEKTFSGCSALTSVTFSNATSVGVEAFKDCHSLESVSFSSLMGIGSSVFANCYSLKSVIIRRQGVTSISSTSVFGNCYHIHGVKNSTYNPNGDKDGYFYVPRAYVDSYKSATNWSTYATQFRALEDYTVDGTITGDLDPTKI